jgi:hypothetical protein
MNKVTAHVNHTKCYPITINQMKMYTHFYKIVLDHIIRKLSTAINFSVLTSKLYHDFPVFMFTSALINVRVFKFPLIQHATIEKIIHAILLSCQIRDITQLYI